MTFWFMVNLLKTMQTMLEQFCRYQQHGVKLAAKKCELRSKVRFLGRIVTEGGHNMDPSEVTPV